MNIYFKREKKNHLFIKLIYKLLRIIPLSKKQKLIITLNSEWIFNRLSHEYSYDVYSRTNHPQRISFSEFLSKYLREDFSVLDLGCGSGENTFLISSKVKNVVGIDYDQFAIKYAIKNYNTKNINFVCGDALDYLNKSNKKYDLLILSHILEHLEEPEKFLNQFTNKFKYIYIEVPDLQSTILSTFRNDLNLNLQYSDADHMIEFSRIGIEKIISNSKLNIVDFEYKFGVLRYWCELI